MGSSCDPLRTTEYTGLAYTHFFTKEPIQEEPFSTFVIHMQDTSKYVLTRMLLDTKAKNFLKM